MATAKTNTIGNIQQFIFKKMKLGADESIFIYIRSSFAPPPDARLKDLFDVSCRQSSLTLSSYRFLQNYAINGVLTLQYAVKEAWG